MSTRTTVATDNFNRADGLLGANWTSLNPTFATPEVLSNVFTTPHPSAAARWAGSGTWTADQYAKITVSGLTGSGGAGITMGVIVRASGDLDAARDFYVAYVDDAAAHATVILKIVNGSSTTLSSVSGDGWASGDSIELEAEGTTLTVYRNGVALRNVTDSDLAGSSSTSPGVFASSAEGILGGDNWEGGTLAGTPVLDEDGEWIITTQNW